jgi:hypothetical protein
MFMDAPFRLLRFTDVVRVELDEELGAMVIYASANGTMFFNTTSHFIESPQVNSVKLF